MTIQELKRELKISNKDIADMFGLNLDSYQNSSAKKRYENGLIEFYKVVKINYDKQQTI